LPLAPSIKRSFTGGVWPRKGGRSLLGYAIPPPNVHSTDWRDMLAITESKDMVREEEDKRCRPFVLCKLTAKAPAFQPNVRKLSEPHEESFPPLPPLFSQMRFSESDLSLNRAHWITDTFTRRECARFVPTNKYPEKCGCGRLRSAHIDIPSLTISFLNHHGSDYVQKRREPGSDPNATDDQIEIVQPRLRGRRTGKLGERWSLRKHTICLPTNAFGTIEFQGGCLDLHLQPKLARVFRKGLLRAATTTGAWIITSGVDTGVVRHVAAAFEGASSISRNKVVCIGISPWGLLKKRDDGCFHFQDVCVPYYPFSSKTRFTALNNRHSYFLLVDNGSVGRYGAEVILRKRLETYIAQKQKISGGSRSVPVVCVILEGGSCTIRSVLDYVTNVPRVPVVVCDGSGRAADLLAFAHQTVREDGSFPDGVRPQLAELVQRVFDCGGATADKVVTELIMCTQQKHLMTVFRLGEKGGQDVDHAILSALLKGQNLSPADQLALALAWSRVDIARSDIFTSGQDWPQAALHSAMMEALINDRVDFVRLLLENGVNMQRFLTIGRLEELYNTDKGPPNTLYYIVRDVVKVRQGYRYKLPHIGLVVEKLMGNAYKSSYTTSEFRSKYSAFMKKFRVRDASGRGYGGKTCPTGGGSGGRSRGGSGPIAEGVAAASGSRALSNHILWRSAFRRDNPMVMRQTNIGDSRECCSELDDDLSNTGGSDNPRLKEYEFRYPFSELLLWAVLTKRQEMAMCLWQHGEEALAKALVACRLYKSLATEAAEDYLEVEICDELKKYAEEFRVLSLELLEHCYHQDDAQTLQLLTYELSNWGCQTCLSLAVIVNNKQFLAHPCCQILLADLWHGGLRIRSHSNLKVLCGLLFPISIFMLEFKTREELLNQPQVTPWLRPNRNLSMPPMMFRLQQNMNKDQKRSRRVSHGSVQSLNIASVRLLVDVSLAAALRIQRPLKIRRRLYEFYTAPITTFWAWTLSFCLFLAAFTYVLLIRTPPKPTWLEWVLFAYVIAFGMEHFRKFLMSEMQPLGQKLKYFFYNYWNTVTTIAVISFIVGFGMRTFGVLSTGRVILACNSVLWTMKLLDYMSVHPRLGPYITMAGKMILNMSYIIVMLVVSLLAFGLARQSITFPNEDWHWLLVRNIFYKPYFMLYGEVYADEIDNCGDEAWDAHLERGVPITNSTFGDTCVPGFWIPPVLMTFFLLVANILLMSMLIAIFNHIFDQTDEIAQQIWLFQRYRQVMEYESTPFIPPPFTPLSHAALAIRYVKMRLRRKKMFDFSLKLFLNDDQVEKLHDFEEDCMDDLAREKELRKRTSNEERILRTAERTDVILNRLNDLASKEVATRETVSDLDNRLLGIEKTQVSSLFQLFSLQVTLF
uniref:LSDAT_euk domain-containing protein n=1 Tax=Heligmosomoides polygyrus TaxID=6339 RepID=A0A8L8KAX7_HELPZ